jgi:hypothetical protein
MGRQNPCPHAIEQHKLGNPEIKKEQTLKRHILPTKKQQQTRTPLVLPGGLPAGGKGKDTFPWHHRLIFLNAPRTAYPGINL